MSISDTITKKTSYRELVRATLFHQGGQNPRFFKALKCKEGKDSYFEDLGGGIEVIDKSHIDALKRELKEEGGLDEWMYTIHADQGIAEHIITENGAERRITQYLVELHVSPSVIQLRDEHMAGIWFDTPGYRTGWRYPDQEDIAQKMIVQQLAIQEGKKSPLTSYLVPV